MDDVGITRFVKAGGPLTKRISLAADESIVSDGSACTLWAGTAQHMQIANLSELGRLIDGMATNEAITGASR